ncbi:hypothetical protein F2Q69_00052155 [Brassica cretica]|uniref:F-box domain-containing protein n=1 Tax=Brassica cretica TaxID=69181 RepID=A0A8S9MR77_BRACR|nr:hypothetical protein F2Q69_00052155 [Brassica cretica]
MANFNLASLPPSTLHKILSKVATTSIRDFGSARVAFSGSNAVGRENHFYKSVVFIFLNGWIYEVNVVRTFKLKCYQLGNPEAIYLRGMYEYFILHYLMKEGKKFILLVIEDAFWPNMLMMYHMITSWALSGHWGYNKPDVYVTIGKNRSQRLI